MPCCLLPGSPCWLSWAKLEQTRELSGMRKSTRGNRGLNRKADSGPVVVEQGSMNTLLDVADSSYPRVLVMLLNTSFLNPTKTATAGPSVCVNSQVRRGAGAIWGLLLALSVYRMRKARASSSLVSVLVPGSHSWPECRRTGTAYFQNALYISFTRLAPSQQRRLMLPVCEGE